MQVNRIGQFIKSFELLFCGKLAIEDQVVEGVSVVGLIEIDKFQHHLVFVGVTHTGVAIGDNARVRVSRQNGQDTR